MTENIRYQFWIVLAAAAIFFTYLGAASLFDEDETLYASCAREMMDRGDWVVPMFNGNMFPDKPPLMFWLMMTGFELFGQTEFGARFFSAVLGIATALLTYHLARLLFNNNKVGLWSGLIVASSIIFTVSARAATVDSALVFVTTLAMFCFLATKWIRGSGFGIQQTNKTKPIAHEHSTSKLTLNSSLIPNPSSFILYIIFLLFYLCLGLAILAKGPVGFLLPMASIGLYLMFVNSRREENELNHTSAIQTKTKFASLLHTFHPKNFLKSLWQLHPITGAIVVLAVALPWFILVGQRTEGLWVEQFFAKFNWRPFVQPILGHSGPVWYYIPAVLIGFFPWSVFLGPSSIDTIRRIREDDPRRDSYIFLATWFAVFFVFWSICSTKLPHYLLPAYPALAILTGSFLEAWITQPVRVGPSWMKNAWITTIAVGFVIIIATGVVAWIYLPGEFIIGTVGIVLIAGGWLCLHFFKLHYRRRAITAFAATAVVFLTAVFGFAEQRVDHHQNARRLMALIKDNSTQSTPICAYRFFRQSMVYYAGHPVVHCHTPEQLQKFLAQTPTAYVITLDKYKAEVEHLHPGQFHILTRERRFLATDDMIVFAPIAENDSPQTANRIETTNRE